MLRSYHDGNGYRGHAGHLFTFYVYCPASPVIPLVERSFCTI